MAAKDAANTSETPIADERALAGSMRTGSSTARNYAIAAVGEFLGTFLFFLTAYVATQAAKNSAAEGSSQSVTLLLYISLSFALALTANVWLFYRVSGGLFNPALTAAFVGLRLMTPAKGVLLAAAQLLGGVAAAGVAKALVPGHTLAVRTTLAPDVTVAQGFFVEFFLTAELALAVFMIAVEKHRATHLAPLVIGAALGVGHLVGASLTGASMNPARSFGPALVDLDFASEHWIYWIATLFGAAAAAAIYKGLLLVDYRTANPGQDGDCVDEKGTVFIDPTGSE